MTIKRFKTISQVGRFYKFVSGGGVQLVDANSLTVIFGLNTYGKSTISDILSSVSSNDPSILDGRMSIPRNASINRKVEIGYLDLNGDEVTTVLGTKWTKNDLVGRIDVFDQEFINRNLLSGSEITRLHREHFTDFVLGEEGVALSNSIGEKRETVREMKTTLPSKSPTFVKGKPEKVINRFIALVISKDKDTLELDIQSSREELSRLGRISEIAEEDADNTPVQELQLDPEDLKSRVIGVLTSSYNTVTSAVQSLIQNHIRDHLQGIDDAEKWIRQGVSFSDDENCPYCGAENQYWDQQLVAAYASMFNQAFADFDASIAIQIEELTSEVVAVNSFNPRSQMNTNLQSARVAVQYLPDLKGPVSNLDQLAVTIDGLVETCKSSASIVRGALLTAFVEKSKAPYKSIQRDFDFENFKHARAELNKQVKIFNESSNDIISRLKNLSLELGRMSHGEVERAVTSCNSRIDSALTVISRISESTECDEYLRYKELLADLELDIEIDIKKFEKDQSQYIKDYFTEVNRLFKILGSRHFEIYAESSGRGDKRVYTLRAKFKGTLVPTEILSKVLSESDRRSLALAIFVVRIRRFADHEKRIVVLDDPVVSFDDNRIKQSGILVKELSGEFCHVILITHYSSLVRELVDTQADATYLRITPKADTHVLERAAAEDFVFEPHKSQLEEFCKVMEAGGAKTYQELRTFMEDHLKLRFQLQIRNMSLDTSKLSHLIDALGDNNVISQDSKNRLHGQREMLNPDSHRQGSTQNDEEWRTDAINLLDLLYGNL